MGSSSIRLALTCGDPAGVGPEIIARWLVSRQRLPARIVALGPADWLERLPSRPGLERRAVGSGTRPVRPGRPTVAGARCAAAALEAAAAACQAGECDGVVTAPVSKIGMQGAGWDYPGHTEFFAERWGGRPVMGFAGAGLVLTLATWHIPLAQVSAALTRDALEAAVREAAGLARSLGAPAPRIGVCGLNPHAGEDGLLGMEERERFNPWLQAMRRTLPGLSTCLPGDTVFWRARRGEFDAVVALYHDQGLGPLKTVAFEDAVNVTLGLPWVRTSPDHGTAFSLAGRGQASIGSFSAAVDLAVRLCRARRKPGA